KKHLWTKRNVKLRRPGNAWVRIDDHETGAFRKRESVAWSNAVAVSPRAAIIGKRALQSFNPIVAVDARNNLSGNVDNVTGVNARSIPTWLCRRTVNRTDEVSTHCTVRSEAHVVTSCRRCSDLTKNEKCG